MIVIARSGTAIAAELGAMKINGEIAALERLGIDPERYLLLPRVIGAATSVMLLTIYFVLTSFVVLSDCLVWPPYIVRSGLSRDCCLTWNTRSGCLDGKGSAFGLIIPLICCNAGCQLVPVPRKSPRLQPGLSLPASFQFLFWMG